MPRSGIVTFLLTLAGAAALCIYVEFLDFLLAWLIAVTVVTFCTYGFDKSAAGSGRRRVPEKVLLALAFAGGTAGAMLGMRLFRHKTVKSSFRIKFLLVVVLQIALVAAFYLLIAPKLQGN
jgi:uncharacterized membrane protein YsdA (DUF1294 family)